MTTIVQDGHPALRNDAQPVPINEITSDKFQDIIKQMNHALHTQRDGVAIAAPQIGEEWQIFTVAPTIFKYPNEEQLVYINPEIIKVSKKKRWLEEGCLSCRWKIGEVERSLEATIKAYDQHGNEFTENADGLLAHIFQHETDHLHSTLFVDKARKLRDMTEAEIEEATR